MASLKIDKGPDSYTALSHVDSKSVNRKTGDVAQTWILPKGVPSLAYKKGKDVHVCGDCPLRSKPSGGNGACYVTVVQGPDAVARGVKDKPVSPLPEKINKPIRLGAYGDPAFTSLKVIKDLVGRSTGHLGYTHQWHKRPDLAPYCMASIDPAMAKAQGVSVSTLKNKAKRLGFRTFRILTSKQKPHKDEVLCPHYTHGVQCVDCGLCAGSTSKAKNIAIYVHGSSKSNLLKIGA